MTFKTFKTVAQVKIEAGEIPGRQYDYFNPPHGGRPPSDAAVKAATARYVEAERRGDLDKLRPDRRR